MAASGTVKPGGVVIFDAAANAVSPASSSATTTNIIGVCLDYAQGASDTFVRVIPFVPGQIWEADCVSAISTASILKRHQLYDHQVLQNITGVTESATTGIFLVYNVTGATTGSGKVIGEFLRRTPTRGDGFAVV